jgi:hypothetical protein
MIEDKEHGIKISTDPEETLWNNLKKRTEDQIRSTQVEKEINEYLLPYIEEKLKKWKTHKKQKT